MLNLFACHFIVALLLASPVAILRKNVGQPLKQNDLACSLKLSIPVGDGRKVGLASPATDQESGVGSDGSLRLCFVDRAFHI